LGWDFTLPIMPYGKRFHIHRRLLQDYLAVDKIKNYEHLLTAEARLLAQNLVRGGDRESYLQQYGCQLSLCSIPSQIGKLGSRHPSFCALHTASGSRNQTKNIRGLQLQLLVPQRIVVPETPLLIYSLSVSCFNALCTNSFSKSNQTPAVKHMPSWFPGTYYANFARENKKWIRALHEVPYARVEKDLVKAANSY
jgi:hypothetical protein